MAIARDSEAALPQGQQSQGLNGITVQRTVVMEATVGPGVDLDAGRSVSLQFPVSKAIAMRDR